MHNPQPSSVLDDCTLAFNLTSQKFLFISRGVEQLLGYSARALYNNPSLLSDMIDEPYRSDVQRRSGAITEGKGINFYYPITLQGGKKKLIRDYRTVVALQDGSGCILISSLREHQPEPPGSPDESLLREQFLSSLIDSQSNFLIRFDMLGRFVFANKPFLKMTGYTSEEITGKPYTLVTLDEEYEMCEHAFVECVNNPGRVVYLAHHKIAKDGSLHDTEWEFVSVTNSLGEVIAVQGIGREETEKHRIERKIKEAAQKMDALVENITDVFFILDIGWKFVKVNSAFEKHFGQKRDTVLGRTIGGVFPAFPGSAFEQEFRRAADTQQAVQFVQYSNVFHKWLSISAYPSADDLTVFVKDISDEVAAQETVARIKNSLEALINNTEDLIWSVDTQARYVHMNKSYRRWITRLTGHEPVEGAGSNQHPGFTAESVEQWEAHYARVLSGEHYMIVDESIDPVTGTSHSFEISFNPIYNSHSEVTGAGCFARDITRRLEAEKAISEQNERLRQIASITSHELRRPVASMLGLINIMDRGNFFNPDNEEIIEYLLTVGNEIDEVIRLIVDQTTLGSVAKKIYP